MRLFTLICLLPVIALADGGDYAKDHPACTVDLLRQTRKQLSKQGSDAAKKAVDAACPDLHSATEDSPPLPLLREYYWFHSDLLLAMGKHGAIDDCVALGRDDLESFPHNNLRSHLDAEPVAKAIAHNLQLCQKAALAGFDEVPVKACDNPQGPTEIPADWRAAFGEAQCAGFRGFSGPRDYYECDNCSALPPLKEKQKSGVITYQNGKAGKRLSADRGIAASERTCGSFDVSFLKKDGKPHLRLRGSDYYCGGGTGSTSYDEIYRVDGRKLVLVKSQQFSPH